MEPKVSSRLHFHIKAADLPAKGNVLLYRPLLLIHSAATHSACHAFTIAKVSNSQYFRRSCRVGLLLRRHILHFGENTHGLLTPHGPVKIGEPPPPLKARCCRFPYYPSQNSAVFPCRRRRNTASPQAVQGSSSR